MNNDINEIKEQLRKLSLKKKLLFAISVCEKLYPNYVFFHDKYHWGNPKVLSDSIAFLYQTLFFKDKIEQQEIEDYINAVDVITPNTEDFSEVYVSFALDACTAVYSSLCFMLDHNIDHVIDVATYARDTVYLSIVNRDELDMNLKGMDSRVINDPLMVGEVTRQVFVIDKLKKIEDKDINDELIQHLNLGAAIINLDTLK